jgi:histidinol-phosphate phosphatase family protein
MPIATIALLILDRDGVLNKMVVNSEHGTVDSPLHPDQVVLNSGVPQALIDLKQLGFKLAIATNQPAAAKGKTTKENLEATHAKIVEDACNPGQIQINSYICWHRAEDQCSCRKPQIGLLINALADAKADSARSWMIGDGVTDIMAGKSAGLKTAFIGPRKTDVCQIFDENNVEPDLWCKDLTDFVKKITQT